MENFITIETRENKVAGLIDFAIAYCQRELVSYISRLLPRYCTLAAILAGPMMGPNFDRRLIWATLAILISGSPRGGKVRDFIWS